MLCETTLTGPSSTVVTEPDNVLNRLYFAEEMEGLRNLGQVAGLGEWLHT
jgi:hypothetical protein